MSFWFEEHGARVTGIDLAPYMIAHARQEASRRDSMVEFVQADIFEHDLGQEHYDLISCFGNSISDFPLTDYAKMIGLATHALKSGGRFVLEYHDGSYEYMQGVSVRTGVYQETPARITFRFKEYLPEIGAYVKTIRNETRGEEYSRKGYIYTVPVVKLVTGNMLPLEQHIILEENHYLDVFIK
jgi:SAM-dependent methyltransferase